MKKFIITSFYFLIGSLPGYSGDYSFFSPFNENARLERGRGSTLFKSQPYVGAYQDYNNFSTLYNNFSSPFAPSDFSLYDPFDENTHLECGSGNTLLKSKNIEETQQYLGFPQVPLVHHYNNFSPPSVLLARKGKIPQGMVRKIPEIGMLMRTVGVQEGDPLLMVVQGFSSIPAADGFSLNPTPKDPLLLRPMYYFSQNKAFDSKTQYTENINIKAAIRGIHSHLSITPDKGKVSHHFGISVHNSGPNTPIISSGNNMAVPGLRYNESTAFFGFYKGVNRTVTGAVKDTTLADDRGVAVLHVLLDENDRDECINQITNGSPLESLLKTILPILAGNPPSRPTVITTPLVAEKEKRPQIAPQKKPQAPVAKALVTARKVARKAPIVHQKSVAPAPKGTTTVVRKPKAPTAVHKVATARRTTSTAARTSSASARRAAIARQRLAARGAAIARQRLLAARGAAVTRQRSVAARGTAIARQRLLAARGAAVTRQRLLAARGAAVTRQRPAVRKAPVVRKKVVTARRAAVARIRR